MGNMISKSEQWIVKITEYCRKYNIPLIYLAEVINEPKVIPMIRGKSFEFSVMMELREILPLDEWMVDKPQLNPQLGLHDVDVRVIHKKTGKVIRVECKLAAKDTYKRLSDGSSEVRIKCMRSRTLGKARVKGLAPKLGIPEAVLSVHNDQYLPTDFDIVVTSIGNAFYRTNKTTGLFEWQPKKEEITFLNALRQNKYNNLKDFAFHQIYLAKSSNLAVSEDNRVVCTRRGCDNPTSCGFIPNYPIIHFEPITNKPTKGWIQIEDSLTLFKELLNTNSVEKLTNSVRTV